MLAHKHTEQYTNHTRVFVHQSESHLQFADVKKYSHFIHPVLLNSYVTSTVLQHLYDVLFLFFYAILKNGSCSIKNTPPASLLLSPSTQLRSNHQYISECYCAPVSFMAGSSLCDDGALGNRRCPAFSFVKQKPMLFPITTHPTLHIPRFPPFFVGLAKTET